MVAALATYLPGGPSDPVPHTRLPGLAAERGAVDGAPRGVALACAAPPPDWSVKAGVRYASTAPLSCLADLAGATADAERRALAFAAGAPPDPASATLASALLHWRHPATAVEGTMLAAASAAWGAARARAWRGALRSAYRAVRAGTLDCFIVLTAEVSGRKEGWWAGVSAPQARGRRPLPLLKTSPRPAAALFRAAGAAGLPRPTVVLAGASVGVAAALAGEEHGAGAGTPLPPAPPLPPGAPPPPPPAALFFEGGPSVHGVFDFLYADAGASLGGGAPPAGGGAPRPADVPLILAPRPFAGAAVASLDLAPAPASRGRHRARLAGPAPPWCVAAVAAALAAAAGARGLDAVADPDPRTTLFNVAAPAGKEGWEAGAGAGAAPEATPSPAPAPAAATDWHAPPPRDLPGCWARRLQADGGGGWNATLERARRAVGVRELR